ncbi:hypothetical protein QF030_008117 [Streptomyces rishiriensis]|uniref:Uncharacterized protein n=1 Tax=Streptomyces rishiriensis TaxID=68264 RepID=A0ABU0P391_STRRH|nr:hypothetical protein [Streptomyces rishiriensis]
MRPPVGGDGAVTAGRAAFTPVAAPVAPVRGPVVPVPVVQVAPVRGPVVPVPVGCAFSATPWGGTPGFPPPRSPVAAWRGGRGRCEHVAGTRPGSAVAVFRRAGRSPGRAASSTAGRSGGPVPFRTVRAVRLPARIPSGPAAGGRGTAAR